MQCNPSPTTNKDTPILSSVSSRPSNNAFTHHVPIPDTRENISQTSVKVKTVLLLLKKQEFTKYQPLTISPLLHGVTNLSHVTITDSTLTNKGFFINGTK